MKKQGQMMEGQASHFVYQLTWLCLRLLLLRLTAGSFRFNFWNNLRFNFWNNLGVIALRFGWPTDAHSWTCSIRCDGRFR